MQTAAAILAGGRASRLGGRAKALLPLGDARIIDRQLAALSGAVDEIFIVADDAELYAPLGVRVVPDQLPRAGPMGGLLTALARSPAPAAVVLACDLPFVSAPFARFLADQCRTLRDIDVALPRTGDGYHPLCACWWREAMPELQRLTAADRWRILDALPALRVREIGPNELAHFDRPVGTLLFNVNTPRDYERARQLTESYHDRADTP